MSTSALHHTLNRASVLGPKISVNCILAGPFLTGVSKAREMEAFAKRAPSPLEQPL